MLFKRRIDDLVLPPIVVGLVGLKRSGKDTVAQILSDIRHGGNVYRLAFADPLRDALRAVFGFSDEQMFGSKKEEVDPFFGVSYRKAAQFVGTNLFRDQFDPNVWIKAWQKRAMALDEDYYLQAAASFFIPRLVIVATDCRFENEVSAIREAGGCVWRIVRDVPFDGHDSERLAATAPDSYFDKVIHNTGALHELHAKVREAALSVGIF